MSACVLLAGGGTGGHVFPLVALAEVFARIAPSVEVRFVGTEQGLEARVVRERGWTLDTLPIEPLAGRSLLGKLRGGVLATAATARATALVAKLRPDLVVSIGGYAAGPISLAAAALGVPVALLEPNRTAGLTHRVLVPIARRVYIGFPEAGTEIGEKGRALGIPLRAGFVPQPPRDRPVDEPIEVLVLGGSQGAEHLNVTLPVAIARAARSVPLRVVHQAGRGRAKDVGDRYARAFDTESARALDDATTDDDRERDRRRGSGKLPVEVLEFVDDVAQRLARADLVVARAGALTCAELCAVGRPSLLVPYPHAADDHQGANAEALAAAGAAICVRQERATPEALAEALVELARDQPRRHEMAERARARGTPDAADRIARDLLSLAGLAREVARV